LLKVTAVAQKGNTETSSAWREDRLWRFRPNWVIAREIGLGHPGEVTDAKMLSDEAGKTLWAMMQKL
jgi:hypothetical protein